MADGLVIKHPVTGAVIFNSETITSHSRAALNTSASAGSLSIPGLTRGSPFVIQALPSDTTPTYNVPEFSIAGQTLAWGASARNMRVLVGSRAVGGAGPATSFDGFMVRRPTGALQISTADQTLQLASYGAVTLSTPVSGAAPSVAGSVTVSGVNPVLAFRGQDGVPVTVERITTAGGFTFHFSAASANPVGLIYWIFDTTSQGLRLDTDVGLLLKDGLGVRTFDSRAYAANMVSNVASPTPSSPTTMQAAGRTYAVIQSTLGAIEEQIDLGGYSYDSSPPEFPIIGEPGRGPGMTWAYMRYQAFKSAAVALANGGVQVSLRQFEFYDQWNPISVQPYTSAFGRTTHTAVDVTGLPSATMPTPSAISVTASATLREVSVSSASNATTDSPAVTVSAAGGAAPYTYAWERVSGATTVVNLDALSATSFRTRSSNQAPASTREAVWRCKVTDAQSRVGYSPNVTFRHIVTLASLTPSPTPTWPNISYSTAAQTGAGSTPARAITGISQAITLRVTVSGYAGGMSGSRLIVYVNGQPLNLTWGNPIANGNRSFTVQPGDEVYFYTDGSNVGAATNSFSVAVHNMSDPGGVTLLSFFTVSGEVDRNNVIDVTPDAISPANLSVSTTNTSGIVSTQFSITGINQPITVRINTAGYSGGLTGAANLIIYRRPSASAAWETITTLNGKAASSVEFTVENGWQVQVLASASSTNQQTGSWNWAVRNQTDGAALLASRTATMTIGPDLTPNAINPGNLSINTTATSGIASTNFTVSSISQTITLQVATGDYAGSLTGVANIIVYRRPNASAAWETVTTLNAKTSQSVNFTVEEGWQVQVLAQASSNPRGSSTWTYAVRNQSMSGTLLASRSVSAAVGP